MKTPGDRVQIWEDPVTQTKVEGWATVVQRIRKLPGVYRGPEGQPGYLNGHLHLYKVRFDGDGQVIHQRTIWSPA